MQEPLVLQAKKGTKYEDGERAPKDFRPIQCGNCGHIINLRKYPDRRKSKLQCGRCKAILVWIPTEAESLEACHRGQKEGRHVKYGKTDE
jgi:hypothetical protein